MTPLWTPPWDTGITWDQEIIDRDAKFLPISVRFVHDKVLRAVSDGAADDLVQFYIIAATQLAERQLNESIQPVTIRWRGTGFPSHVITLPLPPVREVLSVEYHDDDGLQTYGGSPPSYILSGRELQPAVGESWPTPVTRNDAVTVTYTAGYERPEDVPHLTKVGIAFLVGEMYRNPALANVEGQAANQLNLLHFFPRRWA